MKFEYDPIKSDRNKAKHGIDFVEAQKIWEDNALLLIPTAFITEERCMAIGEWQNKVWSCIFTTRGNTIRLISVRRAKKEEETDYYGK